MSSFFGRQWEVLIDNDIYIPKINLYPKIENRRLGLEMKMTFTVLHDFGGFISYADIAFYNLSVDGANKVIKKDKLISLSAGYQDNPYGLIFEGNISNVLYERNGADTITRVIAKNDKSALVPSASKAFGKNTKVTDIIRFCVKSLNYEIEIDDADFAKEPLYTSGYFVGGDPRVYLDKLAKIHRFSYVPEAGFVIVVKDKGFRKGTPPIISQEKGMEGIPELTETGADVNVRLNPTIKIGGRIDIRSSLKTFNFSNLYFQKIEDFAGTGVYRVFRVRHTGDTWGDTWTSKITGIR